MKDWDKYIDSAKDEAEKTSRIHERNKWLDENAQVYGPGHVVSYRETKSGDHIRSDGTLLSTAEERAAQDIPQFKKFEIGRLDDFDGHIIPGPNALDKDWKQYGDNIAKTGAMKTRPHLVKEAKERGHIKEQKTMTRTKTTTKVPNTGDLINVEDLRIQDGSIVCPVSIHNYPPDRDELLGRVYVAGDSTVSMSVLEAKEAGQRYIETVTLSDFLTFILPVSYKWGEIDTGTGDKKQVKLQFYFRDSEQRREVDRWECVVDLPWPLGQPAEVVPPKTALDWADKVIEKHEKGMTEDPPMQKGIMGFEPVRTTTNKIMPDDPEYTPAEKAVNWAAETHHGPAHCERWNRVAAALGVDNGYDPMSEEEIEKWWKHHNHNKRWSMAMEAVGRHWVVVKREQEMARYHSKLSMQGHFSAAQWLQHTGADPTICKFEGYDDLTIYDAGAGPGMPNWWLDGPGEPDELWRLEENGDYTFVKTLTGNEELAKVTSKLYSQMSSGGSAPIPEGYDELVAEENEQTPEQIADFKFKQKLVHEDGPESWVVATVEELPDWYWKLDVWPMNTSTQWGKIQIAPGHFCFWDGSGPRGRWSLDTEPPVKPASGQSAVEKLGPEVAEDAAHTFAMHMSDDDALVMFNALKERLGL